MPRLPTSAVSYLCRPQTFKYSILDAVPPIYAESSHVATDKVPSK